MLQKLNHRRGGFTLVEIMIVVAIIALLAAIAVPNFLRARKRSQATTILEEMRLIDGAKDQYAIEANLAGSAAVTPAQLSAYMKKGTRLYNEFSVGGLNDAIGNPILLGTIDAPPTIAAGTEDNFSDVIDNADSFWLSYHL